MPRDGGADGYHCIGTHGVGAICASLADLQKERRFCIKGQSRCARSIESLIAGSLGFSVDAIEAERKAVFRRANEIRKSVEKGGDGQDAVGALASAAVASLSHLILLSAQSRKLWDDRRAEVEKEMVRVAAQLPVADWARAIRGLGELSLAIVVGEAGRPISDYRTVSALWKRCGLAVVNGERQRKKSGDAALEHAYSPHRRAEVYVVGSVSLFMGQKAGMPYRAVYDARRLHTAPRVAETADLPTTHPLKWTKKRCDNDARRVMTKALLRDLWVEWRRCEQFPQSLPD